MFCLFSLFNVYFFIRNVLEGFFKEKKDDVEEKLEGWKEKVLKVGNIEEKICFVIFLILFI